MLFHHNISLNLVNYFSVQTPKSFLYIVISIEKMAKIWVHIQSSKHVESHKVSSIETFIFWAQTYNAFLKLRSGLKVIYEGMYSVRS